MTTVKQTLRQKRKEERLRLSPEARAAADHLIAEHILASEAYHAADCVLLYSAIRGEVDLHEVACAALRDGKTVAYPRTSGGQMTFHIVRALSELVPGEMHIPSPSEGAPTAALTDRTLMLLPALAYDRDGYRLGWGGGYYDRFLVSYPGIKMGVTREAGLSAAIPHDTHDLPVNMIATELQIYKVK